MPVSGPTVGPGISSPSSGGGGGSGTVTSVSVATANGFAGTVATPTTTPAISVQTSVTGLLKGNGTAVSAAIAGTDYTVSVTAADTSIVIGGSLGAVTVATGTLDVIATQHPPAANWSNNSHKITNLANGTAASDAAAFGQIPTTLPPFTTVAVSATGNSAVSTFELCTTGAGNITRTLPAPVANAIIAYKKIDSGAGHVIISQHAAETIDGATTFTIVTQYQQVSLISDGTNWFIF